MTKDEIRILMRQKRRELTEEFKANSSELITEKIIPICKSLKCVMVYMSSFNEPDTLMLIKHLIKNKINVVIPVSRTSDCTIIPSYISSLDTLNKGAYGIYEPQIINEASIDDVELVLVPGIAFSKTGDRIGFGKGYYDKLLNKFKGIKIGVCYDFQMISEIPASPHDIKMDMIITEKRIYNDF